VSVTVDTPEPEISLLAIWQFLRRNLFIVACCCLVGAAAGLALSHLVTPRYRADLTMSAANNNQGQMGGELGSLAAIAGISIGGESKKAEESLEYIRSRGFTAGFIQRHELLPILYAKKWDAQRGQWKGDPPTLSEAVKRFSNKIRLISEDRRTGIVTLSIVWSDRVLAAQWANSLVAEADDALRQRGIAQLSRSIEYLKQESAQITELEIRSAVYKVMENELKDQMVARTRDSYAFQVLDPAVPPDAKDRDSPNRILYLALGGAFGILIGCAWALARQRPSVR
jgi:uncharacterized protein involved in exopolysaccharide biosynthesis